MFKFGHTTEILCVKLISGLTPDQVKQKLEQFI